MPRLGQLLLSALVLASPTMALSQMVAAGGFPVASGTTNQPYTATEKVTHIQKLADGTTITNVTTNIAARDSQGRTMQQHEMVGGLSKERPIMTTVFDPVEHTMTHWMSHSKTATRVQMKVPSLHVMTSTASAAQPVRTSPGLSALAPGSASVVATVGAFGPAGDPNLRPEMKHEKLGSRDIAGVYAEGTRTTVTYPIGFQGNDRPIVTVNETWQSPDLKIVLLSTYEDPRSGTQTTEVTNLDRAEPDPAIFAPPQGYEIQEQGRQP